MNKIKELFKRDFRGRLNIVSEFRRRYFKLRSQVYEKCNLPFKIKVDKYSGYTWVDKCELLLDVNFQLLKDFVEKEKVFERVELEPEIKEKVEKLYNWYVNVRPARKDPYEEMPDFELETEKVVVNGVTLYQLLPRKFKSKEDEQKYQDILERSRKFDIDCDNEDTEMLIELIKIRGHLWV